MVEPSSDLHHHHEEEVEIGHSLELLKQRQGQEGQWGVFVAAQQIVLATVKKCNSERERDKRDIHIHTV